MQFAKVCRHALVLPALTTLAGCPWPYTAEHDAQVKAIAQEHSTKGAAIDAKFRAALAASLDAKIAADTPCPATFTKPGIEESRFSEDLASWADERRRKLGLPARESEIETMLGSRRQSGGDAKTHDTPFQSRAITIVETKSGFQTLRSASHLDRLREIEAIRRRNSDELKRMGGKDMVAKAKALASDPIDPLELVILATTIVAPKSTPAKPMLGTRSFASGQARGSAFLYRHADGAVVCAGGFSASNSNVIRTTRYGSQSPDEVDDGASLDADLYGNLIDAAIAGLKAMSPRRP